MKVSVLRYVFNIYEALQLICNYTNTKCDMYAVQLHNSSVSLYFMLERFLFLLGICSANLCSLHWKCSPSQCSSCDKL